MVLFWVNHSADEAAGCIINGVTCVVHEKLGACYELGDNKTVM